MEKKIKKTEKVKKIKKLKEIKKDDLAKKNNHDNKATFAKRVISRINIRFFYAMIADFFSFSILFGIVGLFRYMMESKIGNTELPESLSSLSDSQIIPFSTAMQQYYVYFLVLVISFVLLLILFWGLSRAIVWKISNNDSSSNGNKSPSSNGKVSLSSNGKANSNVSFFAKSLLLSLLWFGIGIIIGLLILSTFNLDISINIFTTFFIIFIYFSMFVYMKYCITGKIRVFSYIKEAFFRLDMVFAFLLQFVVFYIITQGLNIISVYSIWLWFLSLFIILFYFSLSRIVFIELYKKRG